MHTIVVDNNNYMQTSVYKPILQCSNLTEYIKILVPEIYFKYDMLDFMAKLEYKTPETGRIGSIELNDPAILENGYIQFVFAVDIDMTEEAGTLKVLLVFTKENEQGGESLVRNVGPADVYVKPIEKWEEDSDSVDKKLAEMQNMIDDIKETQDRMDKEKADNISYTDDMLQLTSNDSLIGDAVKIEKSELTWKEI